MLLEEVFTIANSLTIHCVTKPKTFLQIWDCLLTLPPSWRAGGHWETAAAQETQVSAAHRIQVTASLLLPTWAEVCTWQQSCGQSVFTPTDVSWWTNDMEHLFQQNSCSCFFPPLLLIDLLAKCWLWNGDPPLVMCPGNKTHYFWAFLLQFLLFFGDFLRIHKEQSNKVLWRMCFSVSYFIRDFVLFILQCKYKHLGWFQLMISFLLKISQLRMGWKREKQFWW